MKTELKKALAIASFTLLAAGCSSYAAAAGNTIKIGFITDLSGDYADLDGPGGVEAIKMAIADAGGSVNGKKIELLVADHQNKADIAASKAREWFDVQGIDLLVGGTNSSATLAMAGIAAQKKKVFISVGSGTMQLTNEECNPYTIQYVFDTAAVARGTGAALVKQGGKSWYFLTADLAFGISLEKEAAATIKANGGKVIGEARHPLGASDFSSFLLQAQASKAEVLGLANSGTDFVNAIKGAHEFQINRTMKLAGIVMPISQINSLGLDLAQNMYFTDAWYWDQSDASRKWARRYFATVKKMPGMFQAGDASAASNYLNAVRQVGTDPDKVLAKLRATKIDDFFTTNGVIRPDGSMVHDMYLMRVKTPAESRYPWDYEKWVQTIPGDQAFISKGESKCALWK
ncbi:ABC transporter substrate-binding protein [Paraburkholderia sp. DGU8]|uniref:ABC transporter substrate-binding protein n=1 Tax=Paraburkholderia sp. DGU8 TaxID=3161997 RepID=UPI0034661904